MFRRTIRVAVFAVCTSLAAPVDAQDFDVVLEAAQRGNYGTALKNWQPLAEQGHARAQTYLGVMYAIGRGVPQDYIMAHIWYNLASANGSEDSGKWRDKVAAKMTPADILEAQRRAQVCMSSGYEDCD